MEKKINKFVYWTPRILSIIFILFLALFSLDVFSPGLSFWEIAVGLFMHNILTLILLAVVVISWKREIVGGIVFTLFGIVYIIIAIINVPDWRMALSWSLNPIVGPTFLIGILFLMNWFKKKKITRAA